MSESHYDCPCMEKCPLHHAMQLIGGKWKVQILCAVCNAGAIRYNALRGKLDGVSNTVLSSALRELERDGLVTRQEYLEAVSCCLFWSSCPTGRKSGCNAKRPACAGRRQGVGCCMYQTETRRTPSLAFIKASASSWVMGGSSLAVTSMQRIPFWRVRLLSVIWP